MYRDFSNIELTTLTTLIIASIFSLLISLSLIIEKKGNIQLRNLLLVILIGNFLYAFTHFLGISGLLTYSPVALRIFTPIYYLIPPAIYFYIVINLNESFKYKSIHLLHLLPFIISVIDNAPVFYYSVEELKKHTDIVLNDYRVYGNFQGLFFAVKMNYLFRIFSYTFYLMFSWRYYYSVVNNQMSITEKRIFLWIKNFLIVLGIFVLSTVISLFYNLKYLFVYSPSNTQVNLNLFPFIVVSTAVILLSSFIFFNPILLFGIPRIKELNINQFPPILENVEPNIKFDELIEINDQYENSAKIELNEDSLKELQLAKSTIKEIRELQLYKDTQFSLTKASIHFSIPVHHISFVLNNQMKKSFPDIISEMRIEHAIALIESNTKKKYTLEAIGNMSGFHSRTTFYVSFKKHTGVSPLEFSNLTK
jgi:AraC-like DNA-binding protein